MSPRQKTNLNVNLNACMNLNLNVREWREGVCGCGGGVAVALAVCRSLTSIPESSHMSCDLTHTHSYSTDSVAECVAVCGAVFDMTHSRGHNCRHDWYGYESRNVYRSITLQHTLQLTATHTACA